MHRWFFMTSSSWWEICAWWVSKFRYRLRYLALHAFVVKHNLLPRQDNSQLMFVELQPGIHCLHVVQLYRRVINQFGDRLPYRVILVSRRATLLFILDTPSALLPTLPPAPSINTFTSSWKLLKSKFMPCVCCPNFKWTPAADRKLRAPSFFENVRRVGSVCLNRVRGYKQWQDYSVMDSWKSNCQDGGEGWKPCSLFLLLPWWTPTRLTFDRALDWTQTAGLDVLAELPNHFMNW